MQIVAWNAENKKIKIKEQHTYNAILIMDMMWFCGMVACVWYNVFGLLAVRSIKRCDKCALFAYSCLFRLVFFFFWCRLVGPQPVFLRVFRVFFFFACVLFSLVLNRLSMTHSVSEYV